MKSRVAVISLLALSACARSCLAEKKVVETNDQGSDAGATGATSASTHVPLEGAVIASLPGAHQVEVDADAVYVACQCGSDVPRLGAYAEDIFRIPKEGGPPIRMAKGIPTAHAMALDRGDLFLHVMGKAPPGDGYDIHVRKLSATGGEDTRFTDTWGRAENALAVGGGNVYFFKPTREGEGPREIMRKPTDGGAAQMFVPNLDGRAGPGAFTVDAKHLYFLRGLPDDKELIAAPLDGGAPRVLAKVTEHVWGIQGDGRHVYWSTWAFNAPAKGSVWRVSVEAPGATPEKIANGQGRPWGIALDDRAAYWMVEDGVMRRWKERDLVERVSSSEKPGYDVAVDDRFVYWTSYDKGEVYRAPK